jgi:hypothetical protein
MREVRKGASNVSNGMGFLVVSSGFEDGARGAPDQVDHGDEGVGIAVSTSSGAGSL